MDRAIIVHGLFPEKYFYINGLDSPSNSHWVPWLQQQLCRHDILTQTPEMPRPFAPDYNAWKSELELLKPDENTILVGHSCGGGFLIRWLSDNPQVTVRKVVLVAPWLDIEKKRSPLFDFSLRSNIVDQSKGGIDILYSTNDLLPIKTTMEYLRQNLENVNYHEFVDYGHFTLESMHTREFPELLRICLGN
ncbi:MAG: alpha/beta hydrolase [Candidatus Saccharibacteria bacterium]